MTVDAVELGEGLTLRNVRDERDIERCLVLHRAIFDENTAQTTERLLRHHPEMGHADFQLVEDLATGAIVSTTCLIPWHCRYEDVDLSVAMLEMVGTDPAYRRRGLVRAQVERFHRIIAERRFDLSIVEGIPYYYRQYGYAYVIDHRAYDSLLAVRVPAGCDREERPYELRSAVVSDVSELTRLYSQEMARLGCRNTRDEGYWGFLLQQANFLVRVVQDCRDGRLAGYVAISRSGNRATVRVQESGAQSHAAGMAILRQLRDEAHGVIELGWPESHTLVQIGRSLGSTALPRYQWLLRLPDVGHFLMKIRRVLGRRLERAGLAGVSADLLINFYTRAYRLSLDHGQLTGVVDEGFVDASMGTDGGDLYIPYDAFVRLVFGYRELDELRDAWPDIVVRARSRYLVDALFPRMSSYFCMPYLYCGAGLQVA